MTGLDLKSEEEQKKRELRAQKFSVFLEKENTIDTVAEEDKMDVGKISHFEI